MSDPFLPVPPEEVAARTIREEIEGFEGDRQPDVLEGSGEHDADEITAAEHAAQPDLFRTPEPGERLTAEELDAELG